MFHYMYVSSLPNHRHHMHSLHVDGPRRKINKPCNSIRKKTKIEFTNKKLTNANMYELLYVSPINQSIVVVGRHVGAHAHAYQCVCLLCWRWSWNWRPAD